MTTLDKDIVSYIYSILFYKHSYWLKILINQSECLKVKVM